MSEPAPDSPLPEDNAPGHDDETAPGQAPPEEGAERQDKENNGREDDDVLPLSERIRRAEQSRRLREESLRTLHAGEDLTVGRDWFGDSTVRADRDSRVTYAGRDLHVYESADGPAVQPTSLPAAYLEQLKNCLVVTAAQTELARRLPDEPVLLLRGDENTGRKTTAVGALLTVAADCRRLFLRGEPEQVDASVLAKGVGYILVGDDQPWLSRIGEVVDHLTGVADERGCHMIVLGTPACGSTQRAVDHVVPSAEDVFRNWFTEHLRGEPDAWTRHGMDAREVSERLTGCTPHEAATAARRVAQGVLNNRPIDELLEAQPVFAARRLREDLNADKTGLGRCFLVSSAVLHELPEPVVSAAALDLAGRVWPKEHAEERELDAVWEQLECWLKYSGIGAQPHGATGEGRRVHLRDGFARHLLPTIWEELPAIRRHLYGWLRDLARKPDAHVQIKVAHAVGLLATCDFDMVQREFLHEWSRASGAGPKRLAAMALEAAEGYPEISDKVRRLLDDWAVAGSYEQRTTAAIAYGSRLGAGHVDAALKLFHQVTLPTESYLLCDVVATSLVSLYSPDTADVILDELARWARGADFGPRLAAAFALIWLSGRLVSPWTPSSRTDDSRLADLWINALSLSLPRRQRTRVALDFVGGVWQTLGEWVRVYPNRPSLRPVLERVFETAGTLHLRHRKVYDFHLLAWRHRQIISTALFYHLSDLLRKG